jgi:hypothetical protein
MPWGGAWGGSAAMGQGHVGTLGAPSLLFLSSAFWSLHPMSCGSRGQCHRAKQS